MASNEPSYIVVPGDVGALLASLGERLREARLRRNMTLDQVAASAGFSRKTLAEAERGNPATSVGAYVALFCALGIDDQLEDLASEEREHEELQGGTSRKRARPRGS